MNNVVAIPFIDDNPENNTFGVQLHWRLAGTMSQDVFDKALLAEGFTVEDLPAKPSYATCLKRALSRMSSRRTLVRPMRNKGYSLVDENPEALDREYSDDESHFVQLSAKVMLGKDDSSYVHVFPENHPLKEQLLDEYERQKGMYSMAHDISVWLSQHMVKKLDGLAGRERGGFYYINKENVPMVRKLSKALTSVSSFSVRGRLTNGVKLYLIPTVGEDEVINAILDALLDEVDRNLNEIEAKRVSNNLGSRAYKSLVKRCSKLKEKVSQYAKLLDENLDDVTDRLSCMEKELGHAALTMMNDKCGKIV